MKFKEVVLILILFFFIIAIFFYKTFLYGYIPFPGDLLISEYNPWKTYSYLGYAPGGYPNKAQYFDVIRQIYPWKTFSIDLLKKGQIPLWNPYNFSGSPLLANSQSAIFYLFNIFYFFMPQIIAWSFLVFLQPFLTGVFTYLYARKINLQKLPAFFASITFSFSLFITVFLEYNSINHVVLFLPLLMYLAETIIDKPGFWNAFLFGIFLACALFAGHLQIFGFICFFLFIYIMCRIVVLPLQKREKLAKGLLFFSLAVFGIAVSGVQLFPTMELITLSARAPQSYPFLIEKLLLQPYQLLLFLIPDLFGNPATRNYLIDRSYPSSAIYIGLIPFIFSLFGSIFFLRKNFFTLFFSSTSFVLLIFFVRTPLTEMFYKVNIPLFSTGSPTNAIFLLSFSLSILSGYGLQEWREKAASKKIYFLVFSIGTVFIIVWFLSRFFPISGKNLIYSSGLFFIFSIIIIIAGVVRKNIQFFMALFLIIFIADSFYFFQKFNPFVPSTLVFPSNEILSFLQKNTGINRFWGYGDANIQANFATQYTIFSPEGYDPLYPKIYGEFLQASKDGRIHRQFDNTTRSDAVITPGFENNAFQKQRILNILGVKYILDTKNNANTEKTFSPNIFNQVYTNDTWKIYQNLSALPRVFLASNYRFYSSDDEFSSIFFSKDFDPKQTVLVHRFSQIGNPGSQSKQDDVRVEEYSPNTIRLTTYAVSPKILFLSDTYYPGWHAYIGQKETNIFPADYAFRSIFIPSGKHRILFRYEPRSFLYGIYATISGIIFLSLVSLFVEKKRS